MQAGDTRPESGQAGGRAFLDLLTARLLVRRIADLSHTQRALIYRMQHHVDLGDQDRVDDCMLRYNALDDCIAEARQAIRQHEVPACHG